MDDLTLWKRLKSGDKAALEHIYHEHVSLLFNYGRKFSQDETLVEDCIQDLFIYLWNHREGISETDSIRRYLLVALRRNIIKADRRRIQQSQKLEANAPAFQAELAIEDLWVADEMAAEQGAQLKAAWQKLSTRQQEALYLKYYMEMDYDQICQVMDIHYQSARNLVSQAIHALRKTLTLIIWGLIHFFSHPA